MPTDMDPFMSHMCGRGLAEVFLRGHLWVEKFLSDLLEVELIDPSAVHLGRMPFSQKVNLTLALGLLSPAEATPLRHLNRIRNRLARTLEGDPSADDLDEMRHSLTGLSKPMFDAQVAQMESTPDEVRLLEFRSTPC